MNEQPLALPSSVPRTAIAALLMALAAALPATAIAAPRKAAPSPRAHETPPARGAAHGPSRGPSKGERSARPKGIQAAQAPKSSRGRWSDGGAKHRRKTPPRCARTPVTIERPELQEKARVALTDCDGHALRAAQVEVSSLARRRGIGRPSRDAYEGINDDSAEVTKGVALLHHGLLERLQKIALHFSGKPIAIVSGYRPDSDGSYHQKARALDIHVAGVTNVDLVAFCRTLDDTGCGYYPNSSFVHVDVRPEGKGKVTWIDVSGPGEKPRYVHSWPPKKRTSKLAKEAPAESADETTDDAPAPAPSDDSPYE